MIRDAELTVRVKKIAQDLGAKIVGVAEADRFGEAPEGYRPNDILEDAESVVVLAIPLLKGVLRNAPSREYFLNYFMVNNELNIIALHLGGSWRVKDMKRFPYLLLNPTMLMSIGGISPTAMLLFLQESVVWERTIF